MSVDPPVFTFWLRDSSYNRLERLDLWTEFTIIMRFNRTGSWSLTVPTDSRMGALITPTTGIIVQCDGETIFSGPAGVDYIENSTEITTTGTDDNVLLETPARPTPSLNNGPYPDEYDVTTGVASTIMRSLVNRNIGPAAPSAWIIPQLTMGTDPLLGSTITARARFDPLITLLAELASTPIATGLGFRILQNDDLGDGLTFNVYEPQDLHIETVFSRELQTAEDYEWQHQVPQANYFIVGGGDQFGLNRSIAEGGDATNIAAVGRRVAQFVDRRGVTDISELEQELAELIAGTVTVDTITITPSKTQFPRYRTDYDLGYYVTAVVRGVEYPRIIQEIEINFDPNGGVIIKPVVADPFGGNDELLARHFGSLADRISNIERNFNVPENSIIDNMIHESNRIMVGDIKISARNTAQNYWMFCDGSAISRSTYSQLFAAIGTVYGPGDGSTTFNIPDMRNKFPVGAGDTYALGQSGTTTTGLSHNHSHSHGLNNHTHSGQAHTHPGTHDHILDAHRHQMGHDHDVNIGSFDSGGVNVDTVGVGRDEPGSGSEDHHHSVNPPNTTSTNANNTVTGSGEKTSGGGSFLSTQGDSTVFAASYTGSPSAPSPNSTENDSQTALGTATVVPPYLALRFQIYVRVATL